MDAPRISERAFRADQEMREIVRERRAFRAGLHHVDVVALHSAQHLGPARFDLRRLAPHHGVHARNEGLIGRGRARNMVARAEVECGAVGEQCIDAAHVVHHVAVTNGARAAGVVPGHATQGCLRAGGNIHRKPQAVRPQIGIQPVEHHARLDHGRTRILIEIDDLIQVF